MKSKTSLKLISIIIAVAISATLLFACVGGADASLAPTSWITYLNEFSSVVANTVKGENSKFLIDAQIALNELHQGESDFKEYLIKFKFSFDFADEQGSDNYFILEVEGETQKHGKMNVFSFHSDNDNLYFMVYEEEYDKTSRYLFKESPILSLIKKNFYNKLKEVDFETAFRILGELIFTDGSVNKEKTEYSFDFSLNKLFNESILKTLSNFSEVLPRDIINSVYKVFGVANFEEFEILLPKIGGKIDFSVQSGKISNIHLTDYSQYLNGNIDDSYANIKINKIGFYEKSGFEKFMPYGDESFTEVKVFTLTMAGNFEFNDSKAGRNIVTYDFDLNISLDLITLLNANMDFSVLDDDNYFHLSLSHTCDSKCGSYCSVEDGNKYKRANGKILDIAFSPKDFGTSNIYISAFLQAIVGKNIMRSLIGEDALYLDLVMADYQLITIDKAIFEKKAGSDGDKSKKEDAQLNILDMLQKIFSYIRLDGSSVSLNINEVWKDIFGCSAQGNELTIIKDNFFNSKNYSIDSLVINYEFPQYADIITYDIYKNAILLIDTNVGELKNYKKAEIGTVNPALSWNFNDYQYENYFGEQFPVHNIYDSANGGNRIYGAGTHISQNEAKDLVGLYMEYEFTDYLKSSVDSSGNTLKARAQIIGVENLDYNKTKVFQKARLKVRTPATLVGGIWKQNASGLIDDLLFTYVEVNVRIEALANDGFKLRRTDVDSSGREILNYKITTDSASVHPMLGAVATYTYQDGISKQIRVNGYSDAITVYPQALLGNRYALNKTGEIDIKYDLPGRPLTIKKVNVLKPDSLSIIKTNSLVDSDYTFIRNESIKYAAFNRYKMQLTYGKETVSLKIDTQHYFIDGSPLNKTGAFWAVSANSISNADIVFKRAGIYNTEIKILGQIKTLKIIITTNDYVASSYQLTDANDENTFLTDYNYNLVANVENKTHGSSGLSGQEFSLEIRKGYALNGKIEYPNNITPPTNVYAIGRIQFDGTPIEIGSKVDLPEIILNKINLSYELKFMQFGNYKITLKLGSATLEKFIKVESSQPSPAYDWEVFDDGKKVLQVNESASWQIKGIVNNYATMGMYQMIRLNVYKDGKLHYRYNVEEFVINYSDGREVGNLSSGSLIELPFGYGNSFTITNKIKFLVAGDYQIDIVINGYTTFSRELIVQ